MARLHKATHLKLVEGTRDKRPRRVKAAEPVPQGELTEPPAYFTEEQKVVWADVLAAAPRGLLKRLDGAMLEGWVIAYCLRRKAAEKLEQSALIVKTPNGMPAQSPYVGMVNRQSTILKMLAAEMGFSPAARTRISLEAGAGDEDPNDHFFR